MREEAIVGDHGETFSSPTFDAAGWYPATVTIARKARVRIFGRILPGNRALLHVSSEVGFALRFNPADDEWEAELDLRPKEIKRDIHAL